MRASRRHAQAAAIASRQARQATEHSRIAIRGLSPSAAERLQADVVLADLVLADQARLRHPAVRWWWGVRKDPTGAGAYCYLCDRYVATWDPRWSMPHRARVEVLSHRDQGHAQAARIQGLTPPTSQAGGDPPEGELP